MNDHLENIPSPQDDRPAWIKEFLLASHDAAIDHPRNGCRNRARPHPGAPWVQVRSANRSNWA